MNDPVSLQTRFAYLHAAARREPNPAHAVREQRGTSACPP